MAVSAELTDLQQAVVSQDVALKSHMEAERVELGGMQALLKQLADAQVGQRRHVRFCSGRAPSSRR